MIATKPDRRSCAPGRRCAVGVACLVVGLYCTACSREQESRRTAPTPVEAAPSRAQRAARPAAKAPPAAASVETPAPASVEPALEVVADKPAPAVEEPQPVVAEKAAPVVEKTEAVAERTEVVAERTEAVAERTEAVAEKTEVVAEKTEIVAEKPAPVVEDPAPVAAAEPIETPPSEALEPQPPLEPESPPDHAFLAEAAAQRGDCELALEHYRHARRVSPDDLDLRLGEAQTYRRCGWPGEALELLNELDARSRALEAVAAEIAAAHRMLDEPGKAAMSWELRYIQHPKAWRAAAHAAEAWLEAGQHKPAQWWYEQARRAAPNTPEVRALATVLPSAALTDR